MGKTSMVNRFWQMIDAKPYTFRLADKGPEDFALPYPDLSTGTTRSLPSSGLPMGEGRFGFFVDEIKQASQVATLNVATQLILERRLQDYSLPPETAIIAASNLDSDMAGTLKMPTHLRNRMVHLYLRTSFEDWAIWASGSTLEAPAIHRIRIGAGKPMSMPALLVAFLQNRPELLNCTASGDDAWRSQYAFNTERSWEFVGRLLVESESTIVSDEVLKSCIAGCVGQGPCLELWGFREVASHMPDIKAILSGGYYPPVTDPQIKWVICCALGQMMTKQNCGNAIACLKTLGGEYCALAFKLLKGRLGNRPSALTDLGKPFQEWAAWLLSEKLI
jgi:hypothetical protein